MNVNLLAVSVGNTNTQLGVFAQEKLLQRWTIPNDRLDQDLDAILDQAHATHLHQLDPVGFLLAQVNPPVCEKVLHVLHRHTRQPILRIEEDVPAAIGRQLDPEAIVGEDRLLAAAAAYDVLRQACVVIDAGTAITVDFVDGAGTFHGGAIAPGANLMLAALHQATALLPQITMQRPLEPIGHNTVEAMRTGVFHGLRGMVRELVEQYATIAGAYPMVVATGGDAQLLFEGFDLVERIVPDLVLRGIAVSYRYYLQNQQD